MRTTRRRARKKDKYFCLRCKDQNWLIECACGCHQIIFRYDDHSRLRKYEHHHQPMNRENNGGWKGGISRSCGDYSTILRPNHKYAYKSGRVLLHRYRMELMLGRYLIKEEVVHHIDGNPENNEEDNLMLFSSNGDHISFEITIDMSKRICNLCNKKSDEINHTNKNKPVWNMDIIGFLCAACYTHIKYTRKKMGL